MAKYRINGKFVTFKTFVKTYGLDAVNYKTLGAKEKRIYSGLETYQKRVVLSTGQFAPKTLTENPTIKDFAKNRNMSLGQYIKENEAAINKFMESGLIQRSVNSRSLHNFVKNHKGDIIYKGKTYTAEEFLFKMDMARAKDMSKSTTVETIYNFEVSKNGKTLKLTGLKKIRSAATGKGKKKK